MCGLWGWQWKKNNLPGRKQRGRLSRALAAANDSRGGQAWGAWSEGVVSRGLGPAAPHANSLAGAASLMGHSRWATHGANTLENTHPFVAGGVALCHNGVLSNHAALNREHNRNHEVDSRHLLSHMLEQKPFTDIQGYGTITWVRLDSPEYVYMGRLSPRGELAVVRTQHGVVWSSDGAALRGALRSARIAVEAEYEINVGASYYAEGGAFYQDTALPSIAITQPVVTRHFSSYNGTPSRYWCNKHGRNYARCPCKMSDSWVLFISEEAYKVQKEGEKYIPEWAKNDPSKTYGQNPVESVQIQSYAGADATARRETDLWCNRFRMNVSYCMCPRRDMAWHVGITPEQAQTMQRGWGITKVGSTTIMGPNTALEDSVTTRQDLPTQFCLFGPCRNARTDGSFCAEHEVSLREVGKAPPSQAESYAAWVREEEEKAEEAERAVLVKDLHYETAELWLEEHHQVTPAALVGMSKEHVMDLALEMGFDAEAAMADVLADVEEMFNADATEGQDTDTVSESWTGQKPTDGGTAQAVAGSPKAGS